MLQGKRTRRMVAATLLTILMTDTFAPGISYALTSGPTQPEATSFEPIDTTDMVNLQTGDFTYNIPLLEVPGPEGGYPLSLSYHAGIQPNEDASWVGLGWTLNPGAITRSVNGYPDDWLNLKGSSRAYWSGDHSSVYTIGGTIGIANTPISVNFGLSFSQDTYKGFGVGFDLFVGEKGSPFSLGVSKSPYSQGLTMTEHIDGPTIPAGPLTISSALNVSTNFKSVNVGAYDGIGVTIGMLHGEMRSDRSSPSIGVGGISDFIHNSKNPGFETSRSGFSARIPTPIGSFNVGFEKSRIWTDEDETMYTVGSLYPGSGISGMNSYDNYSLLEDPSSKSIVHYPDPSVLQGGSYPDFDEYQVSAQGLGGNMRPYAFQQNVKGQNHKNSAGTTYETYYNGSVAGAPNGFRFVNDFSNSFRQGYSSYTSAQMEDILASPTGPGPADPFDGNPLFGNTNGQQDYGNGTATNNYGADVTNGVPNARLAGSRYVHVGSVLQPVNDMGYNQSDFFRTGSITGFSITNESGMTYHYGLPAYSYNEESYQEKIDHSQGLFFNRSTKTQPYAYTWYLTTITGSDYVDRNGDGKADDGDWGYWVNFEYGKWSNKYNWRNPSEGFHRDDDDAFQNVSMGVREVYYLNAIQTRNYVALFEKELRNDAKGESPVTFFKTQPSNTDYTNGGVIDINSSQSLRLNRIYLLNVADANFVTPASGVSASYVPTGRTFPCSDCELPANVLDKSDVDAIGRAALEAKAIRVIDFTYDYSLTPGTKNSFNSLDGINALTGKLTLKAVTLKGKGGVSLLPSMQFGYELPASAVKTATGTVTATSFVTSNPVFQKGDLLQGGGVYYGVVTDFNSTTNTYTLANSSFSGSATQTLSTTKNPPYNKDAYDMWGMYKSDFSIPLLANNENLGRNTSDISAKGVDAWSLRSITTQLGDVINLNYESDTYHQVAMSNTYSLVMQNITVVPGSSNGTIQFKLANYGSSVNPGSIIQVGSVFPKITLLLDATYPGCGGCYQKVLPPVGSLTITNLITNGDGSITYTGTLGIPITFSGFTGTIWTGNIWVDQNTDFYGGGIRIFSLTINHVFDNSVSGVNYNYNSPSGSSSGVTTFLPSVLDAYDASAANTNPDPNNRNYGTMSIWVDDYRQTLYQNTNGLYPIARELPSPGVMYEYVTVTNQFTNPGEAARTSAGSTRYQFEVFRTNMVGREDVDPNNPVLQSTSSGPHPNQYFRNVVIKRFTNAIGSLKKITQYDQMGNKLTETTNNYLHDGLEGLSFHDFMAQYYSRLQQYNYQGFLQERYMEIKKIDLGYINPTFPSGLLPTGHTQQFVAGTRATMSGREDYPAIQTGQTVVSFVNGTQTSSKTLAFDFYSGAVTQAVQTDEYGNNFMTSTVPAYHIYGTLGIKLDNTSTQSNLNMLTQTAGSYVWKVDGSNNKLGLVSASATTWSNAFAAMDIDGTTHIQDGRQETVNSVQVSNGNNWRVQSTYNWMPVSQTSDGLTANANFADFNWSNPGASDSRWTKTSDITLYDVFSKSLEARDINGNYSATHLDYGEQRVSLTGIGADYYEIAYSGAEDAAINQSNTVFVQAADGTIATGVAHTGAKSLLLGTSGKKGFLYSVPIGSNKIVPGRDYLASVWVRPISGTASDVKLYYSVGGVTKGNSGSSGSSTKTAGSWTLINLSIKGSDLTSGTLNVWCQNDHASVQAYVDDMRFQPVNAATTAYVYDPFSGELTHMLDNNNLYTRFEYDATGRLVRTYKEKLSIGEFKASQTQYNYGAAKFGNDAINNATYVKNTCPINTGLAGGTVQVSIPANTYVSTISSADANAQAAIYAQDYANTHGVCNCTPGINFASGLTWFDGEVGVSGTRVTLSLAFQFPSSTSFTLGTIAGSCAFPSATRTVPVTLGSAVANFIISPTGTITVQVVSGTPPQNVFFQAVYDQSVNLVYSAQQSGNFTKSCPSGQTGSTVTYTVPAYKYAATDQTTADNLALADVSANGQSYANTNGTCSVPCSFTWASGITPDGQSLSSNGTTVTFTLAFIVPGTGIPTGTTLGTITGPCLPSSPRSVTVVDSFNTSRSWTVTINSSGVVQISLASGTAPTSGEVILNQASFNL